MNPDIQTVNTYADAISAFFTAHPNAKFLLLAWVFGWVVAFIVRPFIRMSPLPDKVESHLVILSCIAASGWAAFEMWGEEYAFIVAVIFGGTSPFGYLALTALICWKFPGAQKHLSLRKDFTSAVDDEPEGPQS